MNDLNLNTYFPVFIFAAYLGWRWLKFAKVKKQLPKLLAEGGQVVDVRSPGEFQAGHHPVSVNIPLGDLNQRAGELNPNRPVILCCASGSRSGIAVRILKSKGFKQVVNVGSWGNVSG